MNEPCKVPGCPNPKVPGQGSKVCQEHRDDAYQRKLARLSERNHRLHGVCQMPDCTEPKLRGRGHKYCARHSAETTQREIAQIVRRKRERQFGVRHEEFLAMLQAQDGICAICGSGNDGARQLSIDHDHATGAIRGLLCDRCNPLLGYARDNVAVLQAAIEYLESYSGIQASGSIALNARSCVPGGFEIDRPGNGTIGAKVRENSPEPIN